MTFEPWLKIFREASEDNHPNLYERVFIYNKEIRSEILEFFSKLFEKFSLDEENEQDYIVVMVSEETVEISKIFFNAWLSGNEKIKESMPEYLRTFSIKKAQRIIETRFITAQCLAANVDELQEYCDKKLASLVDKSFFVKCFPKIYLYDIIGNEHNRVKVNDLLYIKIEKQLKFKDEYLRKRFYESIYLYYLYYIDRVTLIIYEYAKRFIIGDDISKKVDFKKIVKSVNYSQIISNSFSCKDPKSWNIYIEFEDAKDWWRENENVTGFELSPKNLSGLNVNYSDCYIYAYPDITKPKLVGTIDIEPFLENRELTTVTRFMVVPRIFFGNIPVENVSELSERIQEDLKGFKVAELFEIANRSKDKRAIQELNSLVLSLLVFKKFLKRSSLSKGKAYPDFSIQSFNFKRLKHIFNKQNTNDFFQELYEWNPNNEDGLLNEYVGILTRNSDVICTNRFIHNPKEMDKKVEIIIKRIVLKNGVSAEQYIRDRSESGIIFSRETLSAILREELISFVNQINEAISKKGLSISNVNLLGYIAYLLDNGIIEYNININDHIAEIQLNF